MEVADRLVISSGSYHITLVAAGAAIPALLAETFDRGDDRGWWTTVNVFHETRQSVLSVLIRDNTQRGMFGPAVHWVQESAVLFVGAGETIVAYSLGEPRRLWKERAEYGFWKWFSCGDVVLMVAELGLAAYDLRGERLWEAYIEPPHDVGVRDGLVQVEAYQLNSHRPYAGSFDARKGPE